MLKVIELFAGIGAYSKALENLKIEHEVVAAVEFDKKTMDCYNLIHGTDFSPMDITKLTGGELPDCDMICFSCPCQTFSIAGERKGLDDDRGNLFFDVVRIMKAKMPKYFLWENVPGLLSINKGQTIEMMLEILSGLGYEVTLDSINAKDMGTPQNRVRLFGLGRRLDIG